MSSTPLPVTTTSHPPSIVEAAPAAHAQDVTDAPMDTVRDGNPTADLAAGTRSGVHPNGAHEGAHARADASAHGGSHEGVAPAGIHDTGAAQPGHAAAGEHGGGIGHWLVVHLSALGLTGALAATAVTGAVVAWVWVSAWARRLRSMWAAEAVWLVVSPPAVLPASAPLALWQALSGILRRAPRRFPGPSVTLAVEFVADAQRLRAGIWVPPQIAASSVARAVARAWPGARVSRDEPDPLGFHTAAAGRAGGSAGGLWEAVEMRPSDRWVPLIDATSAAGRGAAGGRQVGDSGEERLRGLLAGLADRAPGERACAQLIVTTGAGWQGSWRGQDARWWSGRLIVGTLLLLLRALGGMLDALLPGGRPARRTGGHSAAATTTGQRAEDPAAVAAAKARAAKRAAGPHLHATIRVALRVGVDASAHRRRIRRRLLYEIATGYDLITSTLRTRPVGQARAGQMLGIRAPGAGFAATLAELAALFHLPPEPTRYNMSSARARTGPGGHNIGRIPNRPTPGTTRTNTPASPGRRAGTDPRPTRPPASTPVRSSTAAPSGIGTGRAGDGRERAAKGSRIGHAGGIGQNGMRRRGTLPTDSASHSATQGHVRRGQGRYR
jgi:hypothetical protein